MKSLKLFLTAAMALAVFGPTGRVHAQWGPYNPPISPYINIIRGGSSPAVNWFNIVQPQLEFNSAIGQLQSQQNALGQAITSATTATTTGHPVSFGNYSHYYSRGIGTSSSGIGGGGGMGTGGMGMGGMGGMGMGGMGGMGMGSIGR
jgi:hypothetical protein